MLEDLFFVRFKTIKTFLGKIITSVGCLHSFQGLFYYIILTLERYFTVTGSAVGKTTSNPLENQDSRIYPSDVDEHQNSFKQSAVMFETLDRMRKQIY